MSDSAIDGKNKRAEKAELEIEELLKAVLRSGKMV